MYLVVAGPVSSVQAAAPEVVAAAPADAQLRVLPAEAVRLHHGGKAGPRAARGRLRLLQEVHQVGLRTGTHVQGSLGPSNRVAQRDFTRICSYISHFRIPWRRHVQIQSLDCTSSLQFFT